MGAERVVCSICKFQFLLNTPKALSFRSIELPPDQRVKFISCVLEAVQLPNRDSEIQDVCSDFETSWELQQQMRAVHGDIMDQFMGE